MKVCLDNIKSCRDCPFRQYEEPGYLWGARYWCGLAPKGEIVRVSSFNIPDNCPLFGMKNVTVFNDDEEEEDR